jgi:fructose-specific component phosphotransferase system IIB-like protein
VNAPVPIAIGYVSARDQNVLDEQRHAVTAYARVEGYALAHIVTDGFDRYTISQLVEAARLYDARLVIIPADTTLATVDGRLVHDLEPLNAGCVVIGKASAARDGPDTTSQTASTAAEPAAAAPRPPDSLGRHFHQHEPRHAARTHS